MANIKDTKTVVKDLLAQHLGIEPEDVDEEDTLSGDLHMRATDISDFLEVLEEKSLDTSGIDLTQIETVGELIDALGDTSFEFD